MRECISTLREYHTMTCNGIKRTALVRISKLSYFWHRQPKIAHNTHYHQLLQRHHEYSCHDVVVRLGEGNKVCKHGKKAPQHPDTQ